MSIQHASLSSGSLATAANDAGLLALRAMSGALTSSPYARATEQTCPFIHHINSESRTHRLCCILLLTLGQEEAANFLLREDFSYAILFYNAPAARINLCGVKPRPSERLSGTQDLPDSISRAFARIESSKKEKLQQHGPDRKEAA
jgi:hypothetical protein